MQDLWLIFRCQRGDPDGFAALYERYYRTVFRTALHLVRDQALAEDITQEAFICVFQEIRNLRSTAAFRTWLYRLVLSRTTRVLRTEGGARRPLSLDLMEEGAPGTDTPDPAVAVSDQAELASLREAVGRLPAELRLPVLLHYYAGLRMAEVGQVLGIPAGTVKSRLFAARTQLETDLERGADSHARKSIAKEMRI